EDVIVDSSNEEVNDAIEEVVERSEVKIKAKKNPVKVTVRESGVKVYSGTVRPDFPQIIMVDGDVTISSDDGNDTMIYVNDEKIGLLSKESGDIKNVLINVE
ncbi:hypothetical protein ACFL08_02550, partial [Patescibacteria group bacterium]